MKKNLLPLTVLLSVALLFASCLKDDEEEVVYSDDAAIVSFSMGTLKRYLTTTASDGSDSTYTVSVTGSSYKMYIDQINNLIYNVDSLPYGTDVSKVLCTVSSKNSGTIVIKNIDSDTLKYYSSTDSLDFSVPRKFTAYSYDGSAHRDYTVSVNVHKEKNDEFVWNSNEVSVFDNMTAMKALACNGRVFVFASDGSKTNVFYCSETDNNATWTQATTNLGSTISPYAYQNIVTKDNALYMYNNGRIMKSADGCTWEEISRPTLLRLVAASKKSLYALDNAGAMVSSDDEGTTWKTETLDASSSLLPVQDISYSSLPSNVNDSTEYVVVVGNRSADNYYDDRYAMVWSKLSEYSSRSRDDAWMYVCASDVDTLALPRLSNLALTECDGALIAMGSAGIGACTNTGFTQLYYSKDGGIYWLKDENYQLPDGFASDGVFAMTADSLKRLWIITKGKIWTGYYPDTVWEESQKAFTE